MNITINADVIGLWRQGTRHTSITVFMGIILRCHCNTINWVTSLILPTKAIGSDRRAKMNYIMLG